MDSSNRTRNDEFYAKLERIRLTAAASSSSKSFDFSIKLILFEMLIFQVVGIDQTKTLFFSFFYPNNVLLRIVLICMRQELYAE
jgi:hypothetical protein